MKKHTGKRKLLTGCIFTRILLFFICIATAIIFLSVHTTLHADSDNQNSLDTSISSANDTLDNEDAIRRELSDKLLRFRVLANSDSPADQIQKNQVSSSLATLLRPILSECSSKADAQTRLTALLPQIEEAASTLTASFGENYSVTCTLSTHQFPLKIYQNLTFPAGIYDTLLVTIGEGKGSNWWCLAYPPLCFAEEAYVTVPEETSQTLSDILSPQAYCAISKPSAAKETGKEKEDSQKRFYFRLFPFLNDLFHLED
ncbi:MAG: stage II sporulation protein R [Lachnospiraceae bacterium]|nr:stage II sporulation protein R [Lachnospiraceae bacterium]